jgi:hypothetical protein
VGLGGEQSVISTSAHYAHQQATVGDGIATHANTAPQRQDLSQLAAEAMTVLPQVLLNGRKE